MTEPSEKLQALRAAFDDKYVGKLPRVTCRACGEASSKVCGEHRKSKCDACGNWITSAHTHLDYVGHAEVTDRLLTVDPAWTWEPTGWSAEGSPVVGRSANGRELVLWIKLTVCGVTRLGVGSVEANKPEAEKQLIGDALRNAAMRFGVALNLWSKTELEGAELPDAQPEPTGDARPRSVPRSVPRSPDGLTKYAKAVRNAADRARLPEEILAGFVESVTGSIDLASIGDGNQAGAVTSLIYDWQQQKAAS